MAPTAIEAIAPSSSNFTMSDMLTRDRVDEDEDYAEQEAVQATNRGCALKLGLYVGSEQCLAPCDESADCNCRGKEPCCDGRVLEDGTCNGEDRRH
jgi:hypothetical protein